MQFIQRKTNGDAFVYFVGDGPAGAVIIPIGNDPPLPKVLEMGFWCVKTIAIFEYNG